MINFIIILIIICINSLPITYCGQQFAQIIDSGKYLYKTPNNDKSMTNIICNLDQTYFVQILLNYDQDFYKVNYNNVNGYVLINDVKLVYDSPKQPYVDNIKLKLDNRNCYLRSTPQQLTNNSISIIPANCNSISYIGLIYGQQLEDFGSSVWYYVDYLNIKGYIYSGYLDCLPSIADNIEQVKYKPNIEFTNTINPLSNNTAIIIVLITIIPSIIILYFMYKTPKKKNTKKHKMKIKYDDLNH